eukprot:m.169898 g.169898  ORF g.169898 m.169898 type:complete len:471 (-) comp13484_c3_seq12:3794-5206(-)
MLFLARSRSMLVRVQMGVGRSIGLATKSKGGSALRHVERSSATSPLFSRSLIAMQTCAAEERKNGTSAVVGVLGAVAASLVAATMYSETHECESDANEESATKDKSFKTRTVASYENRLRDYSTPDKVFRYFASVKVDGTVFMTPADFIRAVTPGELQPSDVGLDLFTNHPSTFGCVKDTSARLFPHNSDGRVTSEGDNGLISYAEFLFLVTLLSAPPRQFDFAFKMFDVDGNGTVDLQEFSTVQSAVQKATASGRRIHKKDKTSVSKIDIERSFVIQKLFGKDGKGTCTVEDFHKFLSEVQEDVLHIDFLRHSETDDNKITEVKLSKMLLRYARLKKSEQKAFKERISSHSPHNILEYSDVSKLFLCLRSIDDLALALGIFTRAGSGVSPAEFKRACFVSSGVHLSNNIVSFVFHLFDEDGDNTLSEKEFIAVMKSAGTRGLSNSKDLPVGRGFTALVECIKIQLSQQH